jgi:hypothetical protein
LDVATQQNREHAKYVRGLAHQLRQYADWQTKRIQNWKPADLIPVAEEVEKVHFEVTWSYKSLKTAACAGSIGTAMKLSHQARTTDREKVTCTVCLKRIATMDKNEAERKAKEEREAARQAARAAKEAAAEAKRAAKAAK